MSFHGEKTMGLLFKSRKKESKEHHEHQKKAKVISFLNQKGGVGKTTMCFNAAVALQKAGKRVLCIDMDPQANLSLLFNVEVEENDYSVYHLLINSIRELKPLHSPALTSEVIKRTTSGVDLLPSSQELSGFELSVSGISGSRPLVLRRFLERSGLDELYDFIIIDCPPTLGLLVVNTLCASGGVMVPFRPDEFSKKGLNHLYDVLDDIEDMGVTEIPEVLAHIPNLVDARRKQEMADLQTIEDHLNEEWDGEFKMVSPFYNRSQLVKSQSQRKSVFDFSSKEFIPLQEQFNELATIMQEWNHGQN